MTALERISTIVKNLQRYKATLPGLVLDCVRLHEHTILDLNTQDQLFDKGVTREGQPIEPPYQQLTVSIKRQTGQPTDRVTLKDTGDFHQSFFIAYGGDSFSIGATDSKARKIERKYGSEIYGLTDSNLTIAINEMKPDIFEKSIKMILA